MEKETGANIKTKLLLYLKDIRFWIIFFAIIRLYGITNPPLEIAHSWRQTTVTMAARNFYEIDANILYPRIDISEDLTGITGMEFPILNYMIYLVAEVFGYQHWYGRLINLIISSIGCWFFYLLLKKYFKENIAFYSTFILLVSLWFCYSRKIMPDTFSMSLIIIGLYYGTNYFHSEKPRFVDLFLYALATLAGLLSKLPSGFALVLFVFPIFDKNIALQKKVIFCTVSLVICLPVLFWYWYWTPYLVKEFGLFHFFMGKEMMNGLCELGERWVQTLAHFYDDSLKFIGFGVFLIGLTMCFVKKEKLILRILGLCFLAFFVVMMKSGSTFSIHSYYVIPFVPVMALVAGFGIASIGRAKLRVLFLAVIALENILNQKSDFVIRDYRVPILHLEAVMDNFSERSDLIVINSGENPTAVYFAHRKGWIAENQQLADKGFVDDLVDRGCKYAVILKKAFGEDMKMDYEIMFDSEDYTIYRLKE